MITVLIAAALSAAKFSGGTPTEFADALAKASKQNVIVQQSEGQWIPPCEFEVSDLNELARSIRSQTQMAILPGADLILTDGMLTRQRVQDATTGRPQPNERPANPTRFTFQPIRITKIPFGHSLKNGKVSFETKKDEGLDVMTLKDAFSKPVRIHWLLDESIVSCRVADMPEVDFLKWVAKAVGGRLISNAKEYIMDLDTNEIRRRAINALNREKFTGEPIDIKSLVDKRNFRINCLTALTSDQIRAGLAKDGGEAKFELLPQTPLYRAAVVQYQALGKEAAQRDAIREALDPDTNKHEYKEGASYRIATYVSFSDMALMVDAEKPAFLVMTSQFRIHVELTLRGGGTIRF